MDAGQVAFLAAAIAAAVSLVVATLTSGVALFTSWRQRSNERTLARIEREYQRQADAYLEALTLIYQGMDWINRTLPILSPAPEPPGPAPDETTRRANALIALFGSDRTRARMQDLRKKQRDFEVHVMAHPSAEKKHHPEKEEWGSWSKVQETREECRRLHALVEESMRADLDRT